MEYQCASFQNTVCNIVENWNAYILLCKVGNYNIVFDLYIQNFIYLYLIVKDYSLVCSDINIILFLIFLIVFRLNCIIACYICVQ